MFERYAALLAVTASAIVMLGCAATVPAPTYPPTQKISHTDNYFGTVIDDPYQWLEDDNSPQTRAWVAAQNKTTFGYLDRIAFRPQVLSRIRAISNYARYSAPFKKNEYVFFYKNDGLQNQSVLYVQKGYDGLPEVLLDPNTFSSDGTVRLGSFTLSRDGRYAAYTQTAIAGSDWSDIRVIDMITRRTLPEVLHWNKVSAPAWRGDGFYYTRYPDPPKGAELTVADENQAVWFHKVGTPQGADSLVFDDRAHPKNYIDIATTEDERYAVLTISAPDQRGNSLFVRDHSKTSARAEAAFTPVVDQITEDTFEVVDNDGVQLSILTNRGAPNKRLMRFDPAHPAFDDWTTMVPERSEALEGIAAAGGKLFATYLKDVAAHVVVFDRRGAQQNEIELPGLGSATIQGGERSDSEIFYVFNSMIRPPAIYRYDIASQRSVLFRAPQIPAFDADRFESEQVFFKSRDGTRIPMFIVHLKGMKLDGRNPTILYGYGGFNITMTPYFSSSRIAWLEQGGVFALVNLRGGAEYGEAWHEAGMRFNKQNVFDDCIAAAEYLIGKRYTSPDRLALQGGSNGGLLVGAVINQRPDLFKVALPQVGVMDMLRFQKFTAGTGWVSEYGTSDIEAQFKYLLGYSPLHNIKVGTNYPAVMATTADHDDRVVPAHSFKYIATMQEKAGGTAPHLIRIETNSGHGSSNLSKALEEAADTYSFTWSVMGVTPVFGR
jgi:prolyl oligopeptidase